MKFTSGQCIICYFNYNRKEINYGKYLKILFGNYIIKRIN